MIFYNEDDDIRDFKKGLGDAFSSIFGEAYEELRIYYDLKTIDISKLYYGFSELPYEIPFCVTIESRRFLMIRSLFAYYNGYECVTFTAECGTMADDFNQIVEVMERYHYKLREIRYGRQELYFERPEEKRRLSFYEVDE